jgi:anthranilate synthase
LREGFPLEMIEQLSPDLVLLSPGPGTPEEFKVPDMVGYLATIKMPTFGVCLGHQGIGQHFGGTIAKLPVPEHGKASVVTHNGSPLFSDVSKDFEAGRYHSLYILANTVPSCLEVTAHTYRVGNSLLGNQEEPELIPMAL